VQGGNSFANGGADGFEEGEAGRKDFQQGKISAQSVK
jgi:hypothetical protein